MRLITNLGTLVIELDPEAAPVTVANFLQYVEEGHYNGTIFHRVIPDFMIQGGGYDLAFTERPTREPIANESSNGLKNRRGTVAMARLNDPDSATSQFFINLKNNSFLNAGGRYGGYTVFGEVVEGMEVVDAIAAIPTTQMGPFDDVPEEPVILESAARIE